MPASRFRRVLFCSALVLLLVAVGLFAAACGEAAEETTTTAAPAETTTTAAPAETTTTAAPAETTTTAAAAKEFIFGMLLVGPYNDHGWSQAHYEAGMYVEEKIPGAKMVYVDKVNPADRPGTTAEQLAEDLLAQGAKMIIFNSDDMKDGAIDFAKAHPDIPVIHASGDSAWKEGKDFKDLPNLGNIMGRMEYGKMIAGVRRRPDHPDRQDRLPRSADQRRDPPPGCLRLPGRQVRLDRVPEEGPRRPEVQGQLDRLLVQHPRRHLRPDPGGRRLLSTAATTWSCRASTPPRRWWRRAKLAAAGKKVWAIPYDFVGSHR